MYIYVYPEPQTLNPKPQTPTAEMASRGAALRPRQWGSRRASPLLLCYSRPGVE